MPRHLFLGSALAALAAFALAHATAAAAEECPAGSIARDAITSVRFRAGQYSAAVRTTPVSQMRCVAGPCPMYRDAFDEASCTNTNTNAQGGPIWRCTAHSDAFALTTATVAFEGFRRRGDECVTIGSGALDYGVERLTAPPVPTRWPTRRPSRAPTPPTLPGEDDEDDAHAGPLIYFALFVLFIAGVVALVCIVHAVLKCCCWTRPVTNAQYSGPVQFSSHTAHWDVTGDSPPMAPTYPRAVQVPTPVVVVAEPLVPVFVERQQQQRPQQPPPPQPRAARAAWRPTRIQPTETPTESVAFARTAEREDQAPPVSASVVFARTVDREDQASDCEAKGGHTSVCYAASGEDR